jgi:hypothetical protein
VEAYPVRLVLAGPYLEETATLSSADIYEYLFESDPAIDMAFDGDSVADSFTGTFNADSVEDVANMAFGFDAGLGVLGPICTDFDPDSDDAAYFDPFKNEFTYYVGDINSGDVSFAMDHGSLECFQDEFPFTNSDNLKDKGSHADFTNLAGEKGAGGVVSLLEVALAALHSIRAGISRRICNLCEILCGQGC